MQPGKAKEGADAQEVSREDAISAAWDEAEGESEDVVEAAPETDEVAAEGDETATEGDEGESGVDENGQPRDQHGRFASKGKNGEGAAAEGEGAAAAAEGEVPEGAGAAPVEGDPAAVAAAAAQEGAAAGAGQWKAPNSWRPLERDALTKLPGKEGETVRQAVARREAQMEGFVRDTEGFRRFATDFYGVIQPHQQLMTMLQTTPLKAVQSLMGTASVLYLGPPEMKARGIADLIRQHRIDPAMIADFLDGVDPQGAPGGRAASDPRIDQLTQVVQQLTTSVGSNQQRMEREAQEAADAHVASWAKDKPWYEDVRQRMAKLHAADTSLTLDQLYATAISMDPEIQKLEAQRKKAADVKAKLAKTAADRRAASSPRPNPTVRAKGQPTGDRSKDVENAWDEVEGRVA